MDPVTMKLLISAGLKALPQIGKGIFGFMRGKEGEEMIPGSRAQMTMPESMDEMVNLFKSAAARTELPGQDIITGDIKAGTAGGIQAALEAGGFGSMGAISQMVGKEQEAISGLGVPLAQMKLAAEGQLGSALHKRAGVEQEMEEWNKIQAWKEKYYEGMRRKEKGMEDAFSGFGSLFEGASELFAPGSDLFSGILGGGEDAESGGEKGEKSGNDWAKTVFEGITGTFGKKKPGIEEWLKNTPEWLRDQEMSTEDWIKLEKGNF
jgi:hypothetical protein